MPYRTEPDSYDTARFTDISGRQINTAYAAPQSPASRHEIYNLKIQRKSPFSFYRLKQFHNPKALRSFGLFLVANKTINYKCSINLSNSHIPSNIFTIHAIKCVVDVKTTLGHHHGI